MSTPLHVLEAIADARTANHDLKQYHNEHKEVIDEYLDLLGTANGTMDAAKTSIAANHERIDNDVVDGFRLSYPKKVDVDKLIELVPGVVDMDILKMSVVKKDYDDLVKEGLVTTRQQLQIEVPAETPTIRKPKW